MDSANLFPRQPDAVGVADLRFAVVFRKLLRREDILPIRPGVAGLAIGFIEGVDHKRPLDLDGVFLLAIVEHDPSAKAADWSLARLRQHGFAPQGHQLLGLARFVVVKRPGLPDFRLGGVRANDEQPRDDATDKSMTVSVRFEM